jgi:hypothetical protein
MEMRSLDIPYVITPNLILPEGVKKSPYHPHPPPPPSRGREFQIVFQYVYPLPWRERVG